jgi:hypothetical protein
MSKLINYNTITDDLYCYIRSVSESVEANLCFVGVTIFDCVWKPVEKTTWKSVRNSCRMNICLNFLKGLK